MLKNHHPRYRSPLDPLDSRMLDVAASDEVAAFLSWRGGDVATPLHAMPGLASALNVGAVHIKDESTRLDLGSFKALGGAYAVVRLVMENVVRILRRPIGYGAMCSPEVRTIAKTVTVACATDGNHGRSVAQGAQLLGARSVIFVHSGVSDARVAAIAYFGAEVRRVAGTYDDAIVEAGRVAAEHDWTIVSDTSWPGYERIPALVMQGYTAILREVLPTLSAPPTHLFVQAGVGGLAAALSGHLDLVYQSARPTVVTVEPERAACLLDSAREGRPVKISAGEPTVMAMLECYEPSLIAWRVLSRTADAFMTVSDEDAVIAMNRLARPAGGDPAIVSGESGGAGLAGLARAAENSEMRAMIGLSDKSRVLLINTEGATDPGRYKQLVGVDASVVIAGNA